MENALRGSFDEDLKEERLPCVADLHAERNSQALTSSASLCARHIDNAGITGHLLSRSSPALKAINPDRPTLVSHAESFAIILANSSLFKLPASTSPMSLVAFLATGSDICLIRSNLVDKLCIRSAIQPQRLSSRLHKHSESLVIEGYVFLTWHPKDYPMLQYTSQLWVAPEGPYGDVQYDILLGKPWINAIEGRSDVDRWGQWTKDHYAVGCRMVEA